MEITLHLKPEVEAQLVRQAQAQGMTLKQFLEHTIEQLTTSNESELSINRFSTHEEWLAALNQLGNSPSLAKAPPLSNEAISRESIYSERENQQL